MKVKAIPEDFIVKEVLKVKPQEYGDYRLFLLRKKGLETEEAIRKLSEFLGIPERLFSYGGLKDKNAVTEQFITLPAGVGHKKFHSPHLSFWPVGFLNEPLNPSLVKGNCFEILLRGAKLPDSERVEILMEHGIPNYYGEQRFTSTRKGKTFFQIIDNRELALKFLFLPASWENSRSRKGKKLFLEGNYREASKLLKGWRKKVTLYLMKNPRGFKEAFKLIPERELLFQASIFQAYLFNRTVSRLIENQKGKKLLFKYRMGILLYPLFPAKLPEKLPSYIPKNHGFYDELIKETGINEEWLIPFRQFFRHFNRKVILKPYEFSAVEREEGIRLNLFLPSGAYATNVIRFLYSAV